MLLHTVYNRYRWTLKGLVKNGTQALATSLQRHSSPCLSDVLFSQLGVPLNKSLGATTGYTAGIEQGIQKGFVGQLFL